MATVQQQDDGIGVQEAARPLSEGQARSGLTTALQILAVLAAILTALLFPLLALLTALSGPLASSSPWAMGAWALLFLAGTLGMFIVAIAIVGRKLRMAIRLSAAGVAVAFVLGLMIPIGNPSAGADDALGTLAGAVVLLLLYGGLPLIVLGLCVWLRHRLEEPSPRQPTQPTQAHRIDRRTFLALLTGSSIMGVFVVAGIRALWPKSPTVPDQPRPGTVIYDASESGFAEWKGMSGWRRVNALLVADGSATDDLIGPFKAAGVTNYAVEAEIKLDRIDSFNDGQFGVVARTTKDHTGYRAGLDVSDNGVAFIDGYPVAGRDEGYPKGLQEIAGNRMIGEPFPLDYGWHTYRFEAYGKALSLLIDGRLITHTTDTVSVDGPGTGLFCAGCQISVRNFKVIALS